MTFDFCLTSARSLLFLLCLAAIGYYSYGIYAAIVFFRSSQGENKIFTPPITILKPLCGLDANLYENLAACCQQNYPCYQIICAVRDRHDPSIAIVKQLQKAFPEVDLTLVINERVIGTNLKVSNLANALEKAKYDFLVIADSDINVDSDYLSRIISPMGHPNVGVVTCLYRSHTPKGLGIFQAITTACQFHPSVLVARQLEGMTFAMGASIAIRREILTQIGGFKAIAEHLADDYQLGCLSRLLGYKVVLCDYIVEHHFSHLSVAQLFQQQTRWLRCIRVERFWSYLGLIFIQGIPMSLGFFWLTQGALQGWILLGITWGLRLGLAGLVGVRFLKDRIVKKYFVLIPFWDLVTFGIWCYSLWSDRIVWRGTTFQLTKGGKLRPLEDKTAEIFLKSEI